MTTRILAPALAVVSLAAACGGDSQQQTELPVWSLAFSGWGANAIATIGDDQVTKSDTSLDPDALLPDDGNSWQAVNNSSDGNATTLLSVNHDDTSITFSVTASVEASQLVPGSGPSKDVTATVSFGVNACVQARNAKTLRVSVDCQGSASASGDPGSNSSTGIVGSGDWTVCSIDSQSGAWKMGETSQDSPTNDGEGCVQIPDIVFGAGSNTAFAGAAEVTATITVTVAAEN